MKQNSDVCVLGLKDEAEFNYAGSIQKQLSNNKKCHSPVCHQEVIYLEGNEMTFDY